MADHIAKYERLTFEQERIAKELEALKADTAFQQDMECKEMIKMTLEEKGKTVQDLLRLFPEIVPAESNSKPVRTRKSPQSKRPLIRYTHPETKEVVESKGLNHKTLQSWIAEYDRETVKSWGVVIEDGSSLTDSAAPLKQDGDTSAE